jgi:hypothetical protein
LSLKENIAMVKDELNSEEKFFEKAVMTEKFVKKYKKPLIGAVVAVVLIVVANLAYQASEQNRIESANETLSILEKNPSDDVALAKLGTLSPVLHDVWLYSQAVADKNIKALKDLKDSKALIVNDVAQYEAAEYKGDIKELQAYSQKENAIYKDLSIVMSAVLLMQDGKVEDAKSKLSMINESSPLAQVATALMHYGVK